MAKLSSRSATSTTTSDRVTKTIDSTSNLINNQHQTSIDVTDPRNTTSRHSTSQSLATTYLVLGEPYEENNGDFSSERAAKRRKISTRDNKQSTLDTFFGQPAHAPLKIVQKEPGGKLVEQINGVRHELSLNAVDIGNRQNVNKPVKKVKQVEAVKKQEDKRTLRSQDDGPRVKSDLATYFPNYEEVLFPTEKQAELLDVNTVLYISDTATKKSESGSPVRSIKSRSPTARRASLVQASPSQNANVLDLTSVSNFITDDGEDPLTDDVFIGSHKRAEKKEKQMRNYERERAMHEKSQLERLRDGLLGHDWLKVLGITGVTETEGKKFESKRQYFIDEVRALLKRFEEYRKEENRQKRGTVIPTRRAADDDDDEDESEISSSGARSADLNASASRQLQQETAIAMKSQNRKAKERAIIPERPPSPISSFFESRHKRETALNKNRTSRNTAAFGQPLPEPEEREFALPAEYLTADVLRASARERRRRNRESAVNARSRPP